MLFSTYRGFFRNGVLSLLVGVAVIFPATVANAGFTWRLEDGGNGHHYELILPSDPSGNYTWFEARDAAANSVYLGSTGHLLTITSAAEDLFLRTSFESLIRVDHLPGASGDFVWLGLSDAAQEGVYRWVTGESLSYSNWAPPEPNNFSDEDYVHLWRRDYSDGAGPRWSWNDSDPGPTVARWDTARFGYIVEYDGPIVAPVPGPSALVISASGGMCLAGWYFRRQFRCAGGPDGTTLTRGQ